MRAFSLAGLAALAVACRPTASPLELPEGAVSGAIVLVFDRLAFAIDVEPSTTIAADFPADLTPELFVYQARLAQMQIDVDEDHRVVTAEAAPDRPLPVARAQFFRGAGWIARDDASVRDRVRLPRFDIERCFAADGCFERTSPDVCLAPCPPTEAIVPPLPPQPPEPPRPPVLSPCPPDSVEVAIVRGIDDCRRPVISACPPGQVRAWGESTCAPVGACGAGPFPATPADFYVSPGASGNGTADSPFGTITDALNVATPGAILALSMGDHPAPARAIEDVTLIGACAAGTRITGRLSIGSSGRARELWATSGLQIERASVDLSRVLISDAFTIGGGSRVTGDEVYVVASNGTGIRVESSTVALSRWGVVGGGTALHALQSSVRLERGAIDDNEDGVRIEGGDAVISRLSGGTSVGRRFSESLAAQAGAHVVATDVLVGGQATAGRSRLELTRARLFGLTALEGQVVGRDLRIIDGTMFFEETSTVELEDLVRVRNGDIVFGDDIKLSSQLKLTRAVLVDAAMRIEESGALELIDVEITTPEKRGTVYTAEGSLTMTRVRMRDIRTAVRLSHGSALIQDLIVERALEGLILETGTQTTLLRASFQQLKQSAIDSEGVIDAADIEVIDASTEGDLQGMDFDALIFRVGGQLARARVSGALPCTHAVNIVPDVEPSSLPSDIQDLDLVNGSLYLGGPAAVTVLRLRVRGEVRQGVLINGAAQVGLSHVDIELPLTSDWVLRGQSPTALVVDHFRWIGAGRGAQIARDSTFMLSEGLIAGQPRGTLDVEPGLDVQPLLHHVRVEK